MGRIVFKGTTGWEKPSAAAPAVPVLRKRAEQSVSEIRTLLSFRDTYILDTETTGIKGDVRVIELSVIDLEGHVVFNSLFNPGMPLPEEIPELTGITDEMLKDAPFFFQKIGEISRILQGSSVIAWNADFDRKWLTNELLMVSQGMTAASMCWFDAMELCSYASGRARKWYKLIEAKKDHGIGENQEHRATSDCLDTLAVMRRIAGLDSGDDLLSGPAEGKEEEADVL